MSYSTLKARVNGWTHRSDAEQYFDGCLALAEAKLSREIKHPQNETTATVAIVSSEGSLPSDFAAIERVTFGNRSLMVEPYASSRIPVAGQATKYAIRGTTMVLDTIPTNGDASITYYQRIPALTVSDPTNWLETLAPDLYFYAVMAEMGDALNDEQMVAKYEAKRDKASRELNSDGRKMKYGNAPLTVTTR